MRRFTLLVVLVAFTFSCGGQWYVLQGVAWVNMIREYSEMVPLPQAVAMTFSGEYPCAICKAIAEKKHETVGSFALEKKAKKFLVRDLIFERPFVSVSTLKYFVPESFLRERPEAPPKPPPRLA